MISDVKILISLSMLHLCNQLSNPSIVRVIKYSLERLTKAVQIIIRQKLFEQLVLTIFCIRDYILDQDITLVEYKRFHGEPDAIYPSITLCIYKPFIPSKIEGLGANVNIYSYKDFLFGYDYDGWNSSFSSINYDNVSINILDYLKYVEMNLLNNDNLRWDVENNSHLLTNHDARWLNHDTVKPPEIYVSGRMHNKKCFTMNIPMVENKRIYSVEMNMDKDIFPYGIIRPDRNQFFITLHYPFQLLRSYVFSRVRWPSSIKETDCFQLRVSVGSTEVLKRRNKYTDPCNDALETHDNITFLRMIEDIGCSPTHWKIESDLQECNNIKQYKNMNTLLQDAEGYLPPCKSIERLVTMAAGSKCDQTDRIFRLKFYFQEPMYKQINVLRAYGFQSLVGNAGTIDGFYDLICVALVFTLGLHLFI